MPSEINEATAQVEQGAKKFAQALAQGFEALQQSSILKNREELKELIEQLETMNEKMKNVPKPEVVESHREREESPQKPSIPTLGG